MQFSGDLDLIKRHPALTVSVPKLRAAFAWLLTHNWDWLDATKTHDVDLEQGKYGASIQELLSAYSRDLRGKEDVAPASVLATATSLLSDAAVQAAAGPAEAASEQKDQEVEISGALIETAPSGMLALEQIENIMRAHENVVLSHGAAAEDAGDASNVQALELELLSLQAARKAIRKLTSENLRKELLEASTALKEESPLLKVVIATGKTLLKSTSPDFWSKAFVHLFPRGDCRENAGKNRNKAMWGTDWTELLMKQVDKPWFRLDNEWQATAYKYIFRRAQIRAAESVIHFNQKFKDEASILNRVAPGELLDLAVNCADHEQLKHALHHSKAVPHVRTAMYHVVKAMRSVSGADSERQKFHKYFQSLRIAHGTGILFFTLNPRDSDSALTLRFLTEGVWKHKVISLDLDEMALFGELQDIRDKHKSALHDMIQQDTVAATECFHLTVRMTFSYLFGCSDAANNISHRESFPLPPDGFACSEIPGLASYISWYMGITEPQLRKSLHLHALLGGLGFRDLDELLEGSLRDIGETFVRVWRYVASVCFRAPEAYEASFGFANPSTTLGQEPLIPVKAEQLQMVGPERAAAFTQAQLDARGVVEEATHAGRQLQRPYESVSPSWVADPNLSDAEWGAKAVTHFNTAFRSCGNHCCIPRVCFKGKMGKKNLCRMFFWHWAKVISRTVAKVGEMVWKRVKGRPLRKRWQACDLIKRGDLPPLEQHPPQKGMPALEANHGFTCRFNPSCSLGPCCNHDVNVLLRLPVLVEAVRRKLVSHMTASNAADTLDISGDGDPFPLQELKAACAEMTNAVIEHEFYSSAYASKEQPKLKELMNAMAKSHAALLQELAAAKAAGKSFTELEIAAKTLHRLVSSTNKCSHKGFPEIVSYLTKEPTYYCSHNFTNLFLFNAQNLALALIQDCVSRKDGATAAEALVTLPVRPSILGQRGKSWNLEDVDYSWRPEILQHVPFYFFACMAVSSKTAPSLPWYCEHNPGDNTWSTHPSASFETSAHLKDVKLVDPATNKPIVSSASHGYVSVRDEAAWPVTVVYGREPQTPHDESTPQEKGQFALWQLLLFHPWRDLQRDLLAPCWKHLHDSDGDHWLAVYAYFESWRRDIFLSADDYVGNYRDATSTPDSCSWQSALYWHVKSKPVMRSMESGFTRSADRKSVAPEYFDAKPQDLEADGVQLNMESGSDNSDVDTDAEDPWKAAARAYAGDQDDADDAALSLVGAAPGQHGASSALSSAGLLPVGDGLRDLLLCAAKFRGRGAEACYSRLSQQRWNDQLNSSFCTKSLLPSHSGKEIVLPSLNTAQVAAMHEKQVNYFKKLDRLET